jgi:PAS domain S-box-containing protein
MKEMTMQLKWTDDASLRRLAEEGIVNTSLDRVSDGRKDPLLHDLLVHKAELEMQNEALRDAQAELASAHERYKILFDKAPVAYVALDSNCQITAANARAAKLLGETPRALLGATFTHFLVPDEAISFERYRREVSGSSTALGAEFTMIVAGGDRREIRLESMSVDGAGAQWCVALTDVTTYNSMVRQLDHDERLRTVQQHASGVAHSLNNLLFSIQAHAELALRFIDPGAPAYAPLMGLRNSVQRCAAATGQLTAFSRAEAAHPTIVDLNAVLSELEPQLPALLGDDIETELNLGASDAAVRLDPKHIEQIVLTAARNARHAMPHGGAFRIETAAAESNETDPARGVARARFVRWTLLDTGIGMTESTRERAFEPFFTTKPPGVGTGLGLSTVKAAVERTGGFVKLESQLGRGTKLVIHLPCATGTSYFPGSPKEGDHPQRPVPSELELDLRGQRPSRAWSRALAGSRRVPCAALDPQRRGRRRVDSGREPRRSDREE